MHGAAAGQPCSGGPLLDPKGPEQRSCVLEHVVHLGWTWMAAHARWPFCRRASQQPGARPGAAQPPPGCSACRPPCFELSGFRSPRWWYGRRRLDRGRADSLFTWLTADLNIAAGPAEGSGSHVGSMCYRLQGPAGGVQLQWAGGSPTPSPALSFHVYKQVINQQKCLQFEQRGRPSNPRNVSCVADTAVGRCTQVPADGPQVRDLQTLACLPGTAAHWILPCNGQLNAA